MQNVVYLCAIHETPGLFRAPMGVRGRARRTVCASAVFMIFESMTSRSPLILEL